jgi:hypothetical protein
MIGSTRVISTTRSRQSGIGSRLWAKTPPQKRFGKDWARLTEDLRFDCEGSLKIKADLFSEIRSVIIPTLVDKVRVFAVYFRFAFSVGTFADVTSSRGISIPIPRIEYTDNALALAVETSPCPDATSSPTS